MGKTLRRFLLALALPTSYLVFALITAYVDNKYCLHNIHRCLLKSDICEGPWCERPWWWVIYNYFISYVMMCVLATAGFFSANLMRNKIYILFASASAIAVLIQLTFRALTFFRLI